jgi:hypothetical protein
MRRTFDFLFGLGRAHAPWSVDAGAIVELVSVAVLVGVYVVGAAVVRPFRRN